MLEHRGPVWRHAPAALGTALLVTAAVVGTQLALADAGTPRSPLSPYKEGGFTVGVAAVDRRISITSADDGSFVLGYTPAGGDVVLDLDLLSGTTAQPWWYDPKTQRTLKMRPLTSEGVARFPIPKDSGDRAWVLVVDDQAAGYGAPTADVVGEAIGTSGGSDLTPATSNGGNANGNSQDSGSQSSGSQDSGSQNSQDSGSQSNGSQDSGSQNSQDSGSQSNGSQDSGTQNNGSQNNGSQNNGSQNNGSQNSQDSGTQNNGSQNNGSQNNGPQNNGSQNNGSQNNGSQNNGSQNNGSQNNGSQNNGSQNNGSQDGGSQNSQDNGSQDKGSQDKGSQDKGSQDKGSQDKGSQDKGSQDKGSQDKNSSDTQPGTDPASGNSPENGKFGDGGSPAGPSRQPVAGPQQQPTAGPKQQPTPGPKQQPAVSSDPSWDKLAGCESSGNWGINSGNGYFGGLQFDAATWKGFGGTQYAPRADQATKSQQIAVATKVRDARGGYSSWPACSSKLGLPK